MKIANTKLEVDRFALVNVNLFSRESGKLPVRITRFKERIVIMMRDLSKKSLSQIYSISLIWLDNLWIKRLQTMMILDHMMSLWGTQSYILLQMNRLVRSMLTNTFQLKMYQRFFWVHSSVNLMKKERKLQKHLSIIKKIMRQNISLSILLTQSGFNMMKEKIKLLMTKNAKISF